MVLVGLNQELEKPKVNKETAENLVIVTLIKLAVYVTDEAINEEGMNITLTDEDKLALLLHSMPADEVVSFMTGVMFALNIPLEHLEGLTFESLKAKYPLRDELKLP